MSQIEKFWIEDRNRVSGEWTRQSHQYYTSKEQAEWCVDMMAAYGNTYDCIRIVRDDQHRPDAPAAK
jgi:hypothetical protein